MIPSSCAWLADEVTDESYDRESDMTRIQERVAKAIELVPRQGALAVGQRALGGSPDIDGSQRYVLADGRLRGDLTEAVSRTRQRLASAGFELIDAAPRPAERTWLTAAMDEMAVRVELFEEGNPNVLPAEPGMVYARIAVALRNSLGDVLSWTHLADN